MRALFMKVSPPAAIAGLLGMMAMGSFEPPLAVRLAVAVGICLSVTLLMPKGLRAVALGLAIAITGGLTLLVAYAAVKLALDAGTVIAALTMLVVGIAVTIAGWRGSPDVTSTTR